MNKQSLIEQLSSNLRAVARGAHDAAKATQSEATSGATPQEKRESARVALEQSSLSKGQSNRAKRAFAEVAVLEGFRLSSEKGRSVVQLGSIVEIEDCDTGEGKTFFVSPVGAGETLSGPDGDGYLTVVTPKSPIGRAVLGHRVNTIVDVTLRGDVREWKITWVE